MRTTGNALKEHIQVLGLSHDAGANTYAWEKEWGTWAAAEADSRSNLFSAVGIGARGVTFTIRRSPKLTLCHAFLWRGRFCFLTSIVDGDPGFQVVRAALCEPAACEAVHRTSGLGTGNRPKVVEEGAVCFPGILTEKYVRYAQEETYAKTETAYVLVTPKVIALDAGDLVTVREGAAAGVYNIQARHVLDEFKNEYEIVRRRDV